MTELEPGDERWDRFLERLPAHSFFVTPTWARVLDAAGLALRCTAVYGTDGERAVLLPLARGTGRLGLTSLRSMPWGTYGGPLTDGAPCQPAAAPLLAFLRRKLGLGWFVATPGPWPHVSLGRPWAVYSTHILDLAPGSDVLWKGLEKDTRNQVRQAERAGVEVMIDESAAGWADYYTMLEASAERWGRRDPGKPRSLFEAVRALASPGHARLWLARHEGRLAAGALCFYGRSEVFYWSGAMHKEHARSRANNLIQWKVIEHAAASGFRLYNMGASSGLEGVRRFKAGFGSRPSEYPAYFVGTGPLRLAPAAMRLAHAFHR